MEPNLTAALMQTIEYEGSDALPGVVAAVESFGSRHVYADHVQMHAKRIAADLRHDKDEIERVFSVIQRCLNQKDGSEVQYVIDSYPMHWASIASNIQALYLALGGDLKKKLAKDAVSAEEAAAVKIQSTYRGKQARIRTHQLRERAQYMRAQYMPPALEDLNPPIDLGGDEDWWGPEIANIVNDFTHAMTLVNDIDDPQQLSHALLQLRDPPTWDYVWLEAP
mmetsp:Transcript_5639/g.12390  ORF Transcript_5639/g.12390 Transcript_5639/m.12390 type:complete len:223 (-) Transcript_5639:115-783(-)